ncbi:MAG: hypothetical protein H0U54_13355 [Acidobacteria bacterium]|nr:hypothetical protein [Acidobacteriota bacterium]
MMKEPMEEHSPIHVSSEKGLEKAERLAPLEERAGKSTHQSLNNEGVISVDTGDLKFPKGFTGEKEGKSWLFGVEPITIIIITFTLAFIAFIAYLISVEPPKTKDEPPPAAEDKP